MLIRGLIGAAVVAIQMWKELIHRLTGLPRDASLPATMLAGGIFAGALHCHPASPTRHLAKLAQPARPSLAGSMTAAAVVRYALRSIGGDHVKDTPFAGTMIAVALTAPVLGIMAALALKPISLSRAVLRAVARALA